MNKNSKIKLIRDAHPRLRFKMRSKLRKIGEHIFHAQGGMSDMSQGGMCDIEKVVKEIREIKKNYIYIEKNLSRAMRHLTNDLAKWSEPPETK